MFEMQDLGWMKEVTAGDSKVWNLNIGGRLEGMKFKYFDLPS